MRIAMILAGGVGARAGFGMPKQFVEVLGRPLIAYTIELYEKHPEVDAIEVVCVESHIDRMKEIIDREGFTKVRWICAGGDTFQGSVINGAKHLAEHADKNDLVLIHYGDSPMTPADVISDSIRVGEEHGNASPAMSELYLVAHRDDDLKTTTFLDRDDVMVLNTPQAIRLDYLLWIYEEAERRGLLETVDPHTIPLMLAMGETVWFSKGSSTNFKMTVVEDFLLFEGRLLARERNGEFCRGAQD